MTAAADPSNPQSPADYLAPYHEAEKQHGADFRATLWAHRKSQQTRFKAIRLAANFENKRILDAGSGLGDFAQHLIDHDVRYARYVGIDGVENVVTAANQRGLPRAEFHAGDLVTDGSLFTRGDPDIVIVSGTLNTMTEFTALTLLEHAWNATGETLIFNFLPTTCGPHAPAQLPPAHRLHTAQMLEWAMGKTWAVRYRQDYFPNGHDGMVRMDKR